MSAKVTRQEITAAMRKLGVAPGDIVLVHSSYKSLGPVEGGADAVIGGMEDALGKEGTLVMPTLCQGDLLRAYASWYMDKPMDEGIYMFYNGADMCDALEQEGLVQRTCCGNAELICMPAKEGTDASLEQLRNHPERWLNEAKMQWLADCKAAAKE